MKEAQGIVDLVRERDSLWFNPPRIPFLGGRNLPCERAVREKGFSLDEGRKPRKREPPTSPPERAFPKGEAMRGDASSIGFLRVPHCPQTPPSSRLISDFSFFLLRRLPVVSLDPIAFFTLPSMRR